MVNEYPTKEMFSKVSQSATSTLRYTSRKCAGWVPEAIVQLSEKDKENQESLAIRCFEETQQQQHEAETVTGVIWP
ncbi:unnamed protein product [Dracunculus medinensis]|uniref:DUF4706 domain-containing protein n=1 Tax=Dracunculus medinensis TaxID=318479 RepID=A0A0N4UP77_DRAME|nr:unnamed protein product [Dracunculus medinensis]